MRFLRLAALLLGGALVFAHPAQAQDLSAASRVSSSAQALPDGFYLEDVVDASFVQPVAVAFAPGGRMFVAEKRGVVRVVVNGVLQAEPFVDIQDEVLNHHDRGLLGIAVDPDFETNRRVYLSYTVDHEETADRGRLDAFARVTRYAGQVGDPNRADPASRRVLVGETFATGIPSCYFSHTIGTLAFGADRSLLVGTGEGAHYGKVDDGDEYNVCFGPGKLDPSENIGAFRSQRLESLAGKVLRIDPETGDGYPSNPFYTGDPAETASKVWALGLRNPFRFAILTDGDADPEAGDPGTLYIGDVGWGTWEEINVARGGENFGWPCYEGPNPHTNYQNATPATNGCSTALAGTLVNGASYLWHHSNASISVPAGRTGRAVMVGAVYEGRKYPDAYDGALFYGDYPNGWLASARVDGGSGPTQERLFDPAAGPIVDAAHDPEGDHLVLVNIGSERVQRLRHVDEAANAAPVASASVLPTQGTVGVQVQFSPEGSFDPDGDPLGYAWDFGDGATSTERAPLHTYTEAGVYTASVAVSDAFATVTKAVTVTVQPGGLPTVRILQPTRDARAAPGEAFPLRASVADTDQAASTLLVQWRVTQIHENHVHPDVFLGAGTETEFVPEGHGEDGELYYYRVTASVRDATGLTATDESVLFLEGATGLSDVTDEGAAFAVAPDGTGLAYASDGEMPPAGSASADQFNSGAAPGRTEAGVGYTFPEPLRFTGLTFQEGRHEADGGWFETVGVQVREAGEWRDVVALTASPAYAANDGRSFDTVDFRFVPTEGDAIRLVGRPGGSNAFVTVGELRAWAVDASDGPGPLPAPWTSADVGTPAAAGSASFEGGAFSVTGGGDLWGGQDRMHLASRALAGNGVLTAYVSALSPNPQWSKGALVVRAGSEAGAPYVGLAVSNLGVHFQVRTEADAATDGPVDLFGRRTPIWLRLERVGTTVTASVSDDGQAWSVVDAATVPALDGEVLVGLAASAADYGAGASATAVFRNVALTAALPTPWASADVGAPAGAGAATAPGGDGSAFDVTGGGDIWGSQDRMHLVSRPLAGDGSVLARVTSPASPSSWAKAGLVLRTGTEAGAPYAGVLLSNLGVHLQVRTATDAPTAGPIDVWGVSGPIWLRLDRTGSEVAAFWSADGTAWEAVGTVDVLALGTEATAGLAVSAADYGAGATASASFTDVAVSSAAGGPPPQTLRAAQALAFGVDPVYPNPVTRRAAVRVYLAEAGPVAITAFDLLGRRVVEQRVEASAGVLDLGLDLRGVPAGSYVLRVEAMGEVSTQRFTVVR